MFVINFSIQGMSPTNYEAADLMSVTIHLPQGALVFKENREC